jgi:hypothetical protein
MLERIAAAFILAAIIFGVSAGIYNGINKEHPISCSADKIMIVAKNGYFCVENAVQIQ